MKLKAKFLGLLSLFDIKDSATVKAITKLAQRFTGIKTLSNLAKSPNSKDDIEPMPMTEVITHVAMNKYLESLVNFEQEIILIPLEDDELPEFDEEDEGGDEGGEGGEGGENVGEEKEAHLEWFLVYFHSVSVNHMTAIPEYAGPRTPTTVTVRISYGGSGIATGTWIAVRIPGLTEQGAYDFQQAMQASPGIWPRGTEVLGDMLTRTESVPGGIKIYVGMYRR